MKFIIFSTDVLPISGLATSGTALRTHGLAQGLKSHGHEVVISVPKTALDGLKKNLTPEQKTPELKEKLKELEEYAFSSHNQAEILTEVNPDAILCGHWPAMALRIKPSQPIIVDLAGPHLLERHYQGSPNQAGAILGKLSVAATADYFIVSGPSQRLYFLSFLMRAGVKNPERRIKNITMPLSPDLPKRDYSNVGDPKFIFGGVFLPWQDPSGPLHTLGQELESRQAGELRLIGGKHPNYSIKEGAYAKLFEELSQNPRITTKPMMPLDSFIDELTQADVALDLMSWNLERQLAMTIRSTTYLWSGLPIIYNNYADLGKLIDKYNAGWTVNPDKPEELKDAIAEIYNNPEIIKEKSINAQKLAREIFSWDKAVQPLLEMLEDKHSPSSSYTDIAFDCPENADMHVSKNNTVQQYFVCRMKGLSKVAMRVATHERQIDENLDLKLYSIERKSSSRHLESKPTKGALLAKKSFEAKDIENNDWLSVEVPPQSDSCGKTYMLEIESACSDPTGVAPWAIKASPYPLVGLFYKGKQVEQLGICLRTSCSKTIANESEEICNDKIVNA